MRATSVYISEDITIQALHYFYKSTYALDKPT